MKLICPDTFVAFTSHSLGQLRKLQITPVRTAMLYSSWYRLSSEYDTRSGVKSDVRKWAVSLTVHTLFSTHSNDSLTDVATEIHWSTEYTVRRDGSVRIATRYGLEVRGINSRCGKRFSAHVQTGPGAYSAFICNKYRVFTRDQSVALTTHVNLGQSLRKESAITLFHLWAFVAFSRVNIIFLYLPGILLLQLNHWQKFLFASNPFDVATSELIQRSQRDFHNRKHC